jgi:hypothetical protein
MLIDDIINEWKSDSKIDSVELDTESLNISNLHAKYLAVKIKHNMKLKGLYLKRKRLLFVLNEYFSGNFNNPTDLSEIKREPCLTKILRAERPMHIEADIDMLKIENSINMEKEIVGAVEEILKSLHSRSFQLSNAIKWRQIELGH